MLRHGCILGKGSMLPVFITGHAQHPAMIAMMIASQTRKPINPPIPPPGQRTKNGIALARKRGKQIGNPNLKADNRKRIAKANAFAESLKGIISSLINSGLTQRQIVDELNKSGVKTVKGCEWKLVTLQRVMKRFGLCTVR